MAPADLVGQIFGAWLGATALHGCRFATWAAQNKRVRYGAFFDRITDATAARLTTHFELARDRDEFGLVVFPQMTMARQICHLVEALSASARWTYSLRSDVPGRIGIDLRWRSPGHLECSAMGFGPLGAMPVTRRAPYFAFGMWPGGHDNPFRTRPDEFVGAGDMSHGIPMDAYVKMRDDTRAMVGSRRDVLMARGVITGITFCLAKAYGARLQQNAALR